MDLGSEGSAPTLYSLRFSTSPLLQDSAPFPLFCWLFSIKVLCRLSPFWKQNKTETKTRIVHTKLRCGLQSSLKESNESVELLGREPTARHWGIEDQYENRWTGELGIRSSSSILMPWEIHIPCSHLHFYLECAWDPDVSRIFKLKRTTNKESPHFC